MLVPSTVGGAITAPSAPGPAPSPAAPAPPRRSSSPTLWTGGTRDPALAGPVSSTMARAHVAQAGRPVPKGPSGSETSPSE